MGLKKGLLVVFEGIDGSGKTTQARLLYEALKARNMDALLSREPTDGVHGRKIRELASRGRDTISPQQEYKLFVEDRKSHVEDLIRPALDKNQAVILDRYYFSTMAYQGALGLDPEKIRRENESFCPRPDLVFLLTVPPRSGINRIKSSRRQAPDLFEKEDYLKKVSAIFENLKDDYIIKMDGTGDPADIQNKILALVDTKLLHP